MQAQPKTQTKDHYDSTSVTWFSLLQIFAGVTFWGVLNIHTVVVPYDLSVFSLPLIVTGFIGIMAAKTKHVCMIGTYMAASIVCIFDVTLLGVLAASTLLNIHHGEHRLPNGTETLPDNFKADIVNITKTTCVLLEFLSLSGFAINLAGSILCCMAMCCGKKKRVTYSTTIPDVSHPLRMNFPATQVPVGGRAPDIQGQPRSLTLEQMAPLPTPPIFSEAPPPYDTATGDGAKSLDSGLRQRSHPTPDAEVKYQVRD